ncbi:hypothetical protein [Mycoplasmopsis glycophila]|uniref:Uncharacterized protein n=1 Tax=Mycoplasmopsis glycophila TaxID=171285 RepID=A0A449AUH6_9BACT|nr:hypothetical protein [Mycoplasmopsis glycophila]VEU70133.1 Uncharacterised protein [Mycoplasmopsis glycophila]
MKKQWKKIFLTTGPILPLVPLLASKCAPEKTENASVKLSEEKKSELIFDLFFKDNQKMLNEKIEEVAKYDYSPLFSSQIWNDFIQKITEIKNDAPNLKEKLLNNQDWQLQAAIEQNLVLKISSFLQISERIKDTQVTVEMLKQSVKEQFKKIQNPTSEIETSFNSLYETFENIGESSSSTSFSKEQTNEFKNKYLQIWFYDTFLIEASSDNNMKELQFFEGKTYSSLNELLGNFLSNTQNNNYLFTSDLKKKWKEIQDQRENEANLNNFEYLKSNITKMYEMQLAFIQMNKSFVEMLSFNSLVSAFPDEQVFKDYKNKSDQIDAEFKSIEIFNLNNMYSFENKVDNLAIELMNKIQNNLDMNSQINPIRLDLRFKEKEDFQPVYVELEKLLEKGLDSYLNIWTQDFVKIMKEIIQNQLDNGLKISYDQVFLFFKNNFINTINSKLDEMILPNEYDIDNMQFFQEKVGNFLEEIAGKFFGVLQQNQAKTQEFQAIAQQKRIKLIQAMEAIGFFKEILKSYEQKVTENNLENYRTKINEQVANSSKEVLTNAIDKDTYEIDLFYKKIQEVMSNLIENNVITLPVSNLFSNTFIETEDLSTFDPNEEPSESFTYIDFNNLRERLNALAQNNSASQEFAAKQIQEFSKYNYQKSEYNLLEDDVKWNNSLVFNYKVGDTKYQDKIYLKIAEVGAGRLISSSDVSKPGTMSYFLNQKYPSASDKKYILSIKFDPSLVKNLKYEPFIDLFSNQSLLGEVHALGFNPLIAKSLSNSTINNQNIFKIDLAYGFGHEGKYLNLKQLGSTLPEETVFSTTTNYSSINFVVEISEIQYKILKSMSVAPISPRINNLVLNPNVTELESWNSRVIELIEFIHENDYSVSTAKLEEILNSSEEGTVKLPKLKAAFDEVFQLTQQEYITKEQQALALNVIEFTLS